MSRRRDGRPFFDHDNRGEGSEQHLRKVSFKNNFGRIGKSKKPDKNMLIRFKLDDDDVEMSGNNARFQANNNNNMRRRGGGGMNSLQNRRHFKGRPGSPGVRNDLKPGDWFQVKIPYGSKYAKDYLFKLLMPKLAPLTFQPVSFYHRGNDAYFFVNDFRVAQMLQNITRRISLHDGHLMVLKVREGLPPHAPVDDTFKEKIKQALARRYVPDHKALDLSRFSKDPEFSGMYCSLSRPSHLTATMEIVSENIPDLVALNLTGNRIGTFEEASLELKKLKNLTILHLGENNLGTLHALNCLKDMGLTELIIEKNPVCRNFADRTHFVSEVRRRFPKLSKLDNVELGPVISFDVGDEAKLPIPQAAYMCNPEGRAIVKAFLSQYFALYDSNNRLDLEQAYNESAFFSLCSSYPANQMNTTARLNAYFLESRNLLRVPDYPRRKSRLYIGKKNVAQFLTTLPQSQHDLSSFVVDLTLFTPALIALSVNGVFREPETLPLANWAVRYFSRSFLIVPVGQGFCIVNEMFYVTNATQEQIDNTFRTEAQGAAILQSPPGATPGVTPSASPAVSPVVPSASRPSPSPQLALDDSVRLQMVQTLAAQSGMNLEWSKKCLDETQWDYDRAVWTFTELQKQGTIPAEAFIK